MTDNKNTCVWGNSRECCFKPATRKIVLSEWMDDHFLALDAHVCDEHYHTLSINTDATLFYNLTTPAARRYYDEIIAPELRALGTKNLKEVERERLDAEWEKKMSDHRILTVNQWREFIAEIEATLAELSIVSWYKGDGTDRLALDIPDDGERHLPMCQRRRCGNLAEGKIRLDDGRIADICQSCLTEITGTEIPEQGAAEDQAIHRRHLHGTAQRQGAP